MILHPSSHYSKQLKLFIAYETYTVYKETFITKTMPTKRIQISTMKLCPMTKNWEYFKQIYIFCDGLCIEEKILVCWMKQIAYIWTLSI